MDAPDIHPVTDMVVQNTDLQASSPTNTCWNQDLLIWPYPPTFLYNPEPVSSGLSSANKLLILFTSFLV